MKNLFNKIIVIFLIALVASCKKDFIYLYPLDQANTANSLNTVVDANLAVLGVYDALQSGGYAEDMTMLNELISGNTYVQPSRLAAAASGDLREIVNFQLTDQNPFMERTWNRSYKGIARANVLLDRIANIPFTNETLKNQYIGEAKFLRAVFYFDMVRFFGGLPITLSEIKSSGEAFALKRSSQEEVYNVIVKDLQEAINLLPLSYTGTNVGRSTHGAAKALLAKVFLTINKPDLALPLLRELTKAPYIYRLMPTYAAVFDTDNIAESIFEIQYTGVVPGEGNIYPDFFLSNDATSGKDVFGAGFMGQGGRGRSLVTQDMYNAYDSPNDPRRDYSISTYFSKLENANVYIIRKYRDAPTSSNNSEDNIIMLRYADVLLMIAEAINKINGPTAEAYDAVDAVRKRSNLPLWTRNLTQETFSANLLNERRKELAFENHRWFDLKRFNKAVEILSAKGYAIQPKHLLFPIPRREIVINPENMTQNPGY